MKVTFTTTPKDFENANYILSTAIDALKNNPRQMELMRLKEADLDQADKFRKSLAKGFLKSSEK